MKTCIECEDVENVSKKRKPKIKKKILKKYFQKVVTLERKQERRK